VHCKRNAEIMTTANLINDRIYTTIQKKLEKTSQDEL
jgi:hypothetical protein